MQASCERHVTVQEKHQMKVPSELLSTRPLSKRSLYPLDSLRNQAEAAGLVLGAGWHVKRKTRKTGRTAGASTTHDVHLD